MFLYLDTSSLVKLYVVEEGSEQVALLVESASYCATSIVAYAEARAAFARRSREQAFTLEEYQRIKLSLESDWGRYIVLLPRPQSKGRDRTSGLKHLRGAD